MPTRLKRSALSWICQSASAPQNGTGRHPASLATSFQHVFRSAVLVNTVPDFIVHLSCNLNGLRNETAHRGAVLAGFNQPLHLLRIVQHVGCKLKPAF